MMEKVELVKHVREHVKYPATKHDIVDGYSRMENVSEEDTQWLEKTLPDKVYKSGEEVMTALGLKSMGVDV